MATFEDVHGPDIVFNALEAKGITANSLAAQLKKELVAKQVSRLKVKGAVPDSDLKTAKGNLKSGIRLISKTGSLSFDKDGDVFGDGESVLQFQDINWTVRQNARKDAHKLLGHYPAVKTQIDLNNGAVNVNIVQFSDVAANNDDNQSPK